jgi:hypothetical protein
MQSRVLTTAIDELQNCRVVALTERCADCLEQPPRSTKSIRMLTSLNDHSRPVAASPLFRPPDAWPRDGWYSRWKRPPPAAIALIVGGSQPSRSDRRRSSHPQACRVQSCRFDER